jgi:hypothetical protein
MTQFPQLEPLDRSYDLGSHPIAAARFNNGDETRFLHGAYFAVGVPLSLQFPALNLAEARLISGHWDAHGTARSFTIPAHLWRTHSTATDVVPSGFVWRWTAAPDETPRDGGLFDVSVSLLSAG